MPENATLYGDGTHPNQCIQYGSFMKHLSRGQAEGVFWGMFMVVVILLVVAATVWAESEKLARCASSNANSHSLIYLPLSIGLLRAPRMS